MIRIQILSILIAIGFLTGSPGRPAFAGAVTSAAKPAGRPARNAAPGLDSFGSVLWRQNVKLGPKQSACIGNQFFGSGASVEFGLLSGRYRDRLYFRTDRKILHEWTLPAADLPGAAEKWAQEFVGRFAATDTLFLELRDVGDPVFATGRDAVRMSDLFRHWIADTFTLDDWRVASELGIPQERFVGPAPEQICELGAGHG